MQRSPHLKAQASAWLIAGRLRRVALGTVIGSLILAANPVAAQQWWPFGKSEERPPVSVPAPIPSQPVYRPPGAPGPGQPGQAPNQGYGRPNAAGPSGGSAQGGICLQLEQRLAAESNKGNQSRDMLPKLDQELSAADRAARSAQMQLDRGECYEYFLFSKTLKSSPACRQANSQLEGARRRVAELDTQRQQLMSGGGRSFQDDIVRELARNNCGNKYTQQANNSGGGSSIWQDEEVSGGNGGQFGNLGYATYRTLCVRLCDGYYFPVSFSTLPQHFDRDADACQSKCAAPVELYYHQNPGSEVEQALSHKTKQPYSSLKVAKLYRTKYLPGCSCKQAEYLPSGGTERRADVAPGAPAAAPQPKR
jgi:Protein of unknown function (DUF2865)